MDLFDMSFERKVKNHAPLSERMRPSCLEEFFGQDDLLKEDGFLYKSLKADSLPSLILYGPPGTGKTTLAEIAAKKTSSKFLRISAVQSGVKELREAVDAAKNSLILSNTPTIVFIDEIHRFNKSQQDFLLPFVENGTIKLIGATTENPYFELNKALLSRMIVVRLEKLSFDDMKKILERALSDEENGLASFNVSIDQEAEKYLIDISKGDARLLLNSLEIAVLSKKKDKDFCVKLNIEDIRNSALQKNISYDKSGTMHYDIISAFIKSMRGSDPDAAVFYLAAMLNAGEDPLFIARRILIFASEDVGLADSNALSVASACFSACSVLGMPECRITLSHAAIYMALAKKNNSQYIAINEAMKDLKEHPDFTVPLYIRDSHNNDKDIFGEHENYIYPHSAKEKIKPQEYMPLEFRGRKYFNEKK